MRLATKQDGSRGLWEHDGQAYLGSPTAPQDRRTGLPADARWECSVDHLARYWAELWVPQGWVATRCPVPCGELRGCRVCRPGWVPVERDWEAAYNDSQGGDA